MMQGTGAAFQAQVSLKKQATDPMSHTPVQSYANLSGSYSLAAKSDGRSHHPLAGNGIAAQIFHTMAGSSIRRNTRVRYCALRGLSRQPRTLITSRRSPSKT